MEELIKGIKSQPRMLSQMKPVLKDRSIADKADRVVYDVWRGVKSINNLRYDLTKIYPERLGKELAKTFGHYHIGNYVEIMEVISGKAWWLLQKQGNSSKIIKEVYLIEGRENEKMIILPEFGLVSINPEKQKELVLSNWLNIEMKNNYQPYQNLRGACYYILEGGFEKNPNYKKVPDLIKLKPKKVPEFEVLNNPEKYREILTIENCYQPL